MNSRLRKVVILGAAALVFPSAILCQSKPEAKGKDQKPSGVTKLRIEVMGGEKKQPVENASVYVKYVQERALAKDKKFEMNFKTNREGVTKVPEVPRGKVLIQVVAEGWKPFGRWYDLEEGQQTIKIHLEKPPRWY
jgi:hypothetical protein